MELGTLWSEGRDLTNCANHARPKRMYYPSYFIKDFQNKQLVGGSMLFDQEKPATLGHIDLYKKIYFILFIYLFYMFSPKKGLGNTHRTKIQLRGSRNKI